MLQKLNGLREGIERTDDRKVHQWQNLLCIHWEQWSGYNISPETVCLIEEPSYLLFNYCLSVPLGSSSVLCLRVEL